MFEKRAAVYSMDNRDSSSSSGGSPGNRRAEDRPIATSKGLSWSRRAALGRSVSAVSGIYTPTATAGFTAVTSSPSLPARKSLERTLIAKTTAPLSPAAAALAVAETASPQYLRQRRTPSADGSSVGNNKPPSTPTAAFAIDGSDKSRRRSSSRETSTDGSGPAVEEGKRPSRQPPIACEDGNKTNYDSVGGTVSTEDKSKGEGVAGGETGIVSCGRNDGIIHAGGEDKVADDYYDADAAAESREAAVPAPAVVRLACNSRRRTASSRGEGFAGPVDSFDDSGDDLGPGSNSTQAGGKEGVSTVVESSASGLTPRTLAAAAAAEEAAKAFVDAIMPPIPAAADTQREGSSSANLEVVRARQQQSQQHRTLDDPMAPASLQPLVSPRTPFRQGAPARSSPAPTAASPPAVMEKLGYNLHRQASQATSTPSAPSKVMASGPAPSSYVPGLGHGGGSIRAVGAFVAAEEDGATTSSTSPPKADEVNASEGSEAAAAAAAAVAGTFVTNTITRAVSTKTSMAGAASTKVEEDDHSELYITPTAQTSPMFWPEPNGENGGGVGSATAGTAKRTGEFVTGRELEGSKTDAAVSPNQEIEESTEELTGLAPRRSFFDHSSSPAAAVTTTPAASFGTHTTPIFSPISSNIGDNEPDETTRTRAQGGVRLLSMRSFQELDGDGASALSPQGSPQLSNIVEEEPEETRKAEEADAYDPLQQRQAGSTICRESDSPPRARGRAAHAPSSLSRPPLTPCQQQVAVATPTMKAMQTTFTTPKQQQHQNLSHPLLAAGSGGSFSSSRSVNSPTRTPSPAAVATLRSPGRRSYLSPGPVRAQGGRSPCRSSGLAGTRLSEVSRWNHFFHTSRFLSRCLFFLFYFNALTWIFVYGKCL